MDLLEDDINNLTYANNYSEIDEDIYSDIDELQQGSDLSEEYNFDDSENIQREMLNLQKQQNLDINRNKNILQQQQKNINNQGLNTNEYFDGEYNYDTIEAFQNNDLNNNILDVDEPSDNELNNSDTKVIILMKMQNQII